ncbi:hypothetical protein FD16_GL001930 [Paucilactobacillus suebicus DSM 5007 = KCTC 3549]|uniref:AP2/ERF domain-containing protein n=1 Tax=Paucilactobacillus suebicus DSM 5007 = KCTC 3549 TaxID=1423807 RepID=A0A0R1W4L0_9LACO|nr:hypothetical protein FD16_GL001930 [Paucilactobacillus suebicus DSM 5007 = KCTC 3549]
MNIVTRAVDMTGKRFGRLVVIKRAKNAKNGGARWLCQCDCGSTKVVDGTRLRSGVTKSCGCIRAEMAKERFRKDPKIRQNMRHKEFLYSPQGIPYSTLKKSKRNRTGQVGVSQDQQTGKWFARLMVNNHYVLLKSFTNFDDAVDARKNAEKKYLFVK